MCNHLCSYDDFNYYINFINKIKKQIQTKKDSETNKLERLILEEQIKLLDSIIQNGYNRLDAKEDIKLKNKKENRKLVRRQIGKNGTP